ncbi:MAG: YbhB/YbcL family Raf kinase inhibitor-like protein [Nitrosopumilus sp.]|nr:YbhB/YbcL family Raf kinase inhibitor-like protein [Nitrosopumilus sp.]
MSEFSIISSNFDEGKEIPKEFGYKFENKEPKLDFKNVPKGTISIGLIMDDPDAMAAVGKIWVHWLQYFDYPSQNLIIEGKTDFGEIGYGGPAPPNGRHTYIFKGYAVDVKLDLKEGYSKQDLEDAMKGHIIAKTKLTGTFAP